MSSMLGAGRYSAGITSGAVLVPEFQWARMGQYREDFIKVPTRLGHMYRYRYAPTPYNFYAEFTKEPQAIDLRDVLDSWDYEFHKLHNQLVDYIRCRRKQIIIIDADDEEFLYGVLCTVCALLDESESDWVVEHQFGTMFTIRHIDTLTEDE